MEGQVTKAQREPGPVGPEEFEIQVFKKKERKKETWGVKEFQEYKKVVLPSSLAA